MEGKIDQLLKEINITGLKSLIDQQSSEEVPINDSKPVILYLANKMSEVDSNTCTQISTYAINALKPRLQPFQESVSFLILVIFLGSDFQKRAC